MLEQSVAADQRSARLMWLWLGILGVGLLVTLGWLSRRILADLERRSNAEARLQEANRFLESLLESLPVMVFAKDARTLRFVRFNRAGEQLVGYPRETMLGKSDADFFPPQQAEFFVSKDREVLSQREPKDIPEEEMTRASMAGASCTPARCRCSMPRVSQPCCWESRSTSPARSRTNGASWH